MVVGRTPIPGGGIGKGKELNKMFGRIRANGWMDGWTGTLGRSIPLELERKTHDH